MFLYVAVHKYEHYLTLNAFVWKYESLSVNESIVLFQNGLFRFRIWTFFKTTIYHLMADDN